MKLKSTLIVLSLIAAPAFASDQAVSKTREQVLAELAQAQQNGEMLAAGDSGMTLKQINPGAYRSTTSTQASCQVPPVYRYACGTIQVFSGASF